MRLRNTLIMAALAALLLGYVYFFEIRGSEERAEAERVADRLLSFESESVSGLILETGEQTISMARVDDAWRITQPHDLAADDGAVSGIVNTLQTADHDRLVEEQAEDLTRFGLDEPEVRVTLQLDDGSTQTIAVGAGTPVGFNVFVQPGDGTAVYTTAASLKDSVNKSLFDVRDRTILSFTDLDVARLDIDTPDLEATVRRGAEQGDGIDRWELSAPLEASADAQAVSSVLTRLRTDKALGYPTDAPTDEDLAEYGLADPEIVVTVWTNEDAAHTLQIGGKAEEPSGYYARRLGSDAVFVVPDGLVDALPESATSLRNRTVVELARDRVDSIEIGRQDESLELQKDGPDWQIRRPRALDGDGATVSALLTGVLNLRAIEFAAGTADEPRFGLAEPYLRVAFGLEAPPAPTDTDPVPAVIEAETVTLLVGAATQIEPDPVEVVDEPDPPAGEQGEPGATEDEPAEPEPVAARYVAIDGEPTVYVVEEDDLSGLDVDLFALRSKTLVSFSQSDVTRVVVDAVGGSYQVDKGEDGEWALAGPAAAADIGTTVDDVLWNLNYLDIEGIATEWDAEPNVDLGSYGLTAPPLRVRVYIDETVVGDVSIGDTVAEELLEDQPQFAPASQTWALVEGHSGVYRIDSKLRDALQTVIDAIS